MGARGHGPALGSLAAWFYWINNAYWMPVGLHGVRGHLPHDLPARAPAPAACRRGRARPGCRPASRSASPGSRSPSAWCACRSPSGCPTWGRWSRSRSSSCLGALGRAVPPLRRPARQRVPLARVRPRRWRDSLAFLPVLLYNALGFELMSSAGEEMRDPQRDVPRVILLSGLVISVVYTLGVLGILIAVPLSELSLLTGTWDALAVLGKPWGAAGGALVLAPRHRLPLRLRGQHRDLEPGREPRGRGRRRRGRAARRSWAASTRATTRPHRAFVIMGVISTPAPAGQRRAVVERRQRLLDDVQAVGRVLPGLVPDGVPGLRDPAAASGPTSRGPTGCRAAPAWRGPRPSSAGCSSRWPARFSSSRRRTSTPRRRARRPGCSRGRRWSRWWWACC